MSERDPFRLDGKVAIVTGAGRGIGAAIAIAMADAGADVGLVARSRTELDEVADRIRARDRRAVVVAEDLRTSRDLPSIIDRIATELGAPDVLVNNAGGANPAAFVETAPSQLDDAFHFNATIPFALVKAATPHLLRRAGASVINGEMRRRILAATPLGRLARPQDVAFAVRWLASPASSYVTGQVINLDGGAQGPTFPVDIPDMDAAVDDVGSVGP